MSFGKLAIALTVIFVVFIVALAGEYLYVHWRRLVFRHRSSRVPPIRGCDGTPNFPIIVPATKDLLYFFCLKPHTQVELDRHEAPEKNTDDGSSPEDQVVDVFKLNEFKGLSRFLSTIMEEDKEEVESTPDIDFSIKPAISSLQLHGEPAEAEEVEAVAATIDQDDGNMKTVFSTPCDSPMFFTPIGSPARDFMESGVFVVSVHAIGNSYDRRSMAV